jgi:RND family efflux transporter MFP subunit
MNRIPAARAARSVLVLTLLAGAAACGRPSTPATPQVGPARDAAPVQVSVAAAEARELPQTLALTGTLVPEQQSELTPLVAGRVTDVLVERGSVVREGEPLMRLRDVDYRSAAQAATAAVEQARARLGITDGNTARFDAEQTAEVRAARANRDVAEESLRRARQLAQSGAMSAQDLERAEAQAAAAREQFNSTLNSMRGAYHQYQSARVQVEQSRRNVTDSVVRAPFSGEVAERRANVGEYVTPQRAVVMLVRTDSLRLELQIPQERVPYVQRGQQVELRVDAWPDRTFTGTIRYISAAIRTDTRSLVAEAIVPNPDGALRPGLFVTARLQLDGRQQAVAVPASAVLSEAGTHRAFVVENGMAQERLVTIVQRTPQEVLISRGVQAGERLATTHLDKLFDGARVQE